MVYNKIYENNDGYHESGLDDLPSDQPEAK